MQGDGGNNLFMPASHIDSPAGAREVVPHLHNARHAHCCRVLKGLRHRKSGPVSVAVVRDIEVAVAVRYGHREGFWQFGPTTRTGHWCIAWGVGVRVHVIIVADHE